jgi:CPA1 family monovalent cation:H+ antiporter
VPYTLGLVVAGLLFALLGVVSRVEITPDLVLFVFLPALLFEGSWSTSVQLLIENRRPILLLAIPGTLLAVGLTAALLHVLGGLAWSSALLLGVIVSPTDPVAVLGLFRQLKVNDQLSAIIEGESLFNDGIAGSLYQGILAFILLSLDQHGTQGAWLPGLGTFFLEIAGGVLIGLLGGFLISRLVRLINDSLIETTITLVAAYGIYLLADVLHCSGILAVVLAGLIIGSYGRRIGMSGRTREVVDNFWSVLAFLANTLVFLLVGAQLNPLQITRSGLVGGFMLIAGLAIVAVLVVRVVIVLLVPRTLPGWDGWLAPSWRFLIFWSGLRGALSLALALALPTGVPDRELLIFATGMVVLFTLLVQGISLRWILLRLPAVAK